MPLQVNLQNHGSVLLLRCAGRIVLGEEARTLEAALEQAMHQSHRLVLNVAKIDRMDSIGLGLLVRFCVRLGRRGGDLRLSEPSEAIGLLLRLTTLTRLFKVYATEEAAIASFRKLSVLPKVPSPCGVRVLVFEPSSDLCVFLQSVLACRGFEVRSATNMPEAKHLLSEAGVDILLVGPGTAQISPAVSAEALAEFAPQASVVQLPSNFKTVDVNDATHTLLTLLEPEMVIARMPFE